MVIAIDTETELIRPGVLAPPLVCVSYCPTGSTSGDVFHQSDAHLEAALRRAFEHTIVGQNFAYDAAVLMARFPALTEPIFRAYEEGRIRDTKIREQLLDIADGRYRGYTDPATREWIKRGYSLEDLAFRYLGRNLDKANSWRLRYGELIRVPLQAWPSDAIDYARTDAEVTLAVYEEQEKRADLLRDEPRQVRAALALHLMACRGLHVDLERVAALERATLEELESCELLLKKNGLVRSNGTRDTKKAKAWMQSVMRRDHGDLPYDDVEGAPPWKLTEKGDVCLDEDACLSSGDPVLKAYSRAASLKSVLAKDIKALSAGLVQSRFDVLAETGRTTCSGYNVQAIRALPGIRECFAARPGMVFVDADFPGLELKTNAQTTINAVGRPSALADALDAKLDPHTIVAAQILGCSYEEAMARVEAHDEEALEKRKFGKLANFGLFNGMGPRGLRRKARKKPYSTHLSQRQAEEIYEAYFQAWPEMRRYHDWVKVICGSAGHASICHFGSERCRGHVPFTVACSSFGQGLGADAAKEALWLICRECYVGDDALSTGYLVNFVHDEYLWEGPEEHAAEAAEQMKAIMEEACTRWTPDAPMRNVKPTISRVWSKEAEQVFDEEGVLQPWEGA